MVGGVRVLQFGFVRWLAQLPCVLGFRLVCLSLTRARCSSRIPSLAESPLSPPSPSRIATLALALSGGALPALKMLALHSIPASAAATAALERAGLFVMRESM